MKQLRDASQVHGTSVSTMRVSRFCVDHLAAAPAPLGADRTWRGTEIPALEYVAFAAAPNFGITPNPLRPKEAPPS